MDNVWTGLNAIYPANKCVKVAKSGGDGTMTTPTINSTGDFTIKIKAGACNGKSNVQLTVKTTAGTLDKSSVSLTADKFNEYSIELSGVTKAFTLTFSIPSKKQSFIDDIEVINKASADTKKDSGISFGETTYTANITDKDDTYHSYVTLNNPNNLSVTYASSKTDVAEVNATGEVKVHGLGTTTISATFAGDDTYKNATVSYELTVVDPNVKVVVFTAGKEIGLQTGSSKKDEMKSGDITISGNNIALNADGPEYRFYANSTFTVSVPTGIITKIVFEGEKEKYGMDRLSSDGYIYASDKLSGTWIGEAKNVTFKNTNNGQAKVKTITVYVTLPSGITLDENSESNTIEAKKGVNVTLKRTMVKGEWNTICLPFEVSEKQAKDAFGEGVKIATLNKKSTGTTISFEDISILGIPASEPCLIKPSIDYPAEGYVFKDVTIAEGDIVPMEDSTDDSSFGFVGIYNKTDISTGIEKTIFMGEFYAAFLGAGNKIYKTDGSGNKTKGFRAYFAIPNGAAASALRVVIDGTATSIKNIDSEVVESNAPVYNLQGQRVNGNNLTPGIYVKAGKKFVVK